MENALECIQHAGIIERITKKTVYVKILSVAACASCNAKSMCNTAEMEEKTIEVANDGKQHKIGESVFVAMDKSLGPKAVLLGYFYPFLTLLVTLIIMLQITNHEGLSALVALGILGPYYLVLYKFRDKIKNKFAFRLQ